MNQQQLNLFEPIEQQVKPVSGNTRLVSASILDEESDFRVHVGYKAQHIYVFSTLDGKKAYERADGILPLKSGSQPGVGGKTFEGYPVPIGFIDDVQSILIPIDIYQKFPIYRELTTTERGLRATCIVFEMLKRQLIKLPIVVNVIDDKDLQIRGTDIIVSSKLKIQVKCDYLAGERGFGGSGNLFLQKAECNPRKMY